MKQSGSENQGLFSASLTYLKIVVPVLERHRNVFSFLDAVRFYLPWLWTMKSRNPLKDRLPWLVFPAIRFLKNILREDARIFEYGSGGSTLFFSRYAEELVSVEHDKKWYERIQLAMQDAQRDSSIQWKGILAEPEIQNPPSNRSSADPHAYTSAVGRYRGLSFIKYASAIDIYPDEYFDIILIDGRSRPSCFLHAIRKVKLGGYIVLDNAERVRYSYIEETAEKLGFVKREFWGPGPYNTYYWRTIFLQRPVSSSVHDVDQHD